MKPVPFMYLVLTMSLVRASPVAAQVPPLEPIPSSSADLVLERRDFRILEPLSLEDLLRQAAGVVVVRRGGLGSLEFLNVAGSVPGRVLLVVNGLEIDEPELQWPRLASVQISMVERLEVYRSVDPARLEIWTREVEGDRPQVDIDLGRGDFETRTRRLQFFTPRRSLSASLSYEELLRGQEDFRAAAHTPAETDLGRFAGRSFGLNVELRRPDGELLRLSHEQYVDIATGSGESQFDQTQTLLGQNALRWRRDLRGASLVVDLAHAAWNRSRVFADSSVVSDARTRAAVDLGLPERAGWTTWIRGRAAELSGEARIATRRERHVEERYDAEVQARRRGRVQYDAWAGAHGQSRLGNSWSAQLRADAEANGWSLSAQAGRGVSFAAFGEPRAADDSAIRPGYFGAASLGRRGVRTEVRLTGFGKRLDGVAGAPRVFFARLGSGPTRVAGGLAEAAWRSEGASRRGGLEVSGAWTPMVRGDRSGLPRLQGRVTARLAQTLFEGDLVATLLSTWNLDSRREFTPSLSLPAAVSGDVTLDALLLKRLSLFWSVRNIASSRTEISPGVAPPRRFNFLGARVQLLN